jgi:hypothetical protein
MQKGTIKGQPFPTEMIGEGKRQGVYTLFDMYFANEDGNRADE